MTMEERPIRERTLELHHSGARIASRLRAVEARLRALEKQHLPLSPAASWDPVGSSTPLLGQQSVPGERIEQAAWQLENAISGRVLSKYPADLVPARRLHLKVLYANRSYTIAMILLVVLTFVEVPVWCQDNDGVDGLWSWELSSDRCTASSEHGVQDNPMLSGISYLPPGYAFIMELLIEFLVLRKLMLECLLERKYFRPMGVVFYPIKLTCLGFLFAIGSIIDTAVVMFVRVPFRLTFIFRTGLIFLQPGILRFSSSIFNKRVMAEFLSVAIFFIGAMVLFAFTALTLFQYDTAPSYEDGEVAVPINEGLDTFPHAVYTMFLGGVTGDFAGCYLPTFMVHPSSAFLWIFYLVLTQILLKNLVTDTLTSQYLKGVDDELMASTQLQACGILTSFELLACPGMGEVLKSDFVAFVQCLRRSPRWKSLPQDMAFWVYDQVGHVTKDLFCDVCMLLQDDFWVTSRNSPLHLETNRYCKRLARWVREPEELPDFDAFMNQVLLLNLVLVVLESTYDVMDLPPPAWTNYIELAFALAYLAEVLIKLAVRSFAEYWSSSANRFDFFTTWLLLCTSVLPYLPIQEVKADLSHYANILRLLRLTRILKQLKQFPSVQFMVFTISRMVAAADDILVLMGIFFFFFCNLSVNLFGGLLCEGNPKLEGTSYAESNWFALNFNDMFMAATTWFMQLLCEYVPAFAEVLQQASQWGDLAWWVVPIFYVTTSAIMYQLLLAFTIDVFLKMQAELSENATLGAELEALEAEEQEEQDQAPPDDKADMGAAEELAETHRLTPHAFFFKVHEALAVQGLEIHYQVRGEATFREAVQGAYQDCVGGSVGTNAAAGFSSQGRAAICKAAWQVEASVSSETIAAFPVDMIGARKSLLQVVRATSFYAKALACLVAVTLLEVPSWCHSSRSSSDDPWTWQPGSDWCTTPSGTDLDLSGLWYMPPGLALLLELAIEFVVLRKFLLEYILEREHFAPLGVAYCKRFTIYLGCLFSLCSIVDTAIFASFRNPIRLTFIFRTGLLSLQPGVQRLSARIFNRKMIGQFIFVAVFFVSSVLLFAWISFSIFRYNDSVSYLTSGKPVLVNTGFESLRNSIYTMFLAGTTTGFIDIFMPSITTYRASAMLWFIFLVLTQVLLLNLVIDTFVASYQDSSEDVVKSAAQAKSQAVLEAFHTLAAKDGKDPSSGSISKETLLEFVDELGRNPLAKPVGRSTAEVMIQHFGKVTKGNFIHFCTLFESQIWVTRKNSCLEACAPGLWNGSRFAWLRRIVWEPTEAPVFDDFMNWVLLWNLVLVVLELMNGRGPLPPWMRLLEGIFTLTYVIEVVIKLLVKSWGEYWISFANRFDFFTTWLLVAAAAVQHLPIAAMSAGFSHYANIPRLLRLLRVVKKLKQYPSFQFMVSTIFRMTHAAGDILLLLGVVGFFFVSFSVNFFGGVLYEGNPKLAGSAYAENHWLVFNFNDAMMASVTWMLQLFNQYTPELADALWRASAYGEVAWLICPAFYLISVAIIFQILVAFTIQTFDELKEEAEKATSDEADDEIDDEMMHGEMVRTRQAFIIRGIFADLKRQGATLHFRIEGKHLFHKKLKTAYIRLCNS